MSAKAWVSVMSCVFILGAGAVGALWIHKSAEFQLSGGPLLAAAAADTVNTAAVSVQSTESRTLKEIIESSQKRVVTIESGDSLGSGFLYNNQGDLLTNAHVVDGSTYVTIRTLNKEEYEGTVIGIGKETDIAVVRVPKMKGMVPLTVSRNHAAEIGDQILALGSPLGLENTVTTGIVSGVERDFEIDNYVYSNMIQISAPITHGNSGGPLIDAVTGEVLGINSAAAEQESGIGFSIPISSVLSQVEEWSMNPLTELSGSNTGNSDEYGTDFPSDEDYEEYYSPAENLVYSYYQCLDQGDYVTAYSLLGSNWQSSSSYADYRNGYIKTLHVAVDDVTVIEEDEHSAQVEALITAEEQRDSGIVYQQYQLSYTLGIENGELKILHGNGKKVN